MIDVSLHIETGGRTVCAASWWRQTRQRSDTVKLYCPLAGQGWIALCEQRVELRPGRLYLVPPHPELSHATPTRITIDWLHFNPNSPWILARLTQLRRIHEFKPPAATYWRGLCRRCSEYLASPNAALTCRFHGMLSELIGLVLEQTTGSSIPASADYERLLPALEYLDNHDTQTVSLGTLAAQVHLSPEHFHRRFKATLGLTPWEYALRRRMALARRLLGQGLHSVAEVAAACGYRDPFYFSRMFRRHCGVTPRQVRLSQVPLGP
ncbi:MAG: AraC family transcriptional regulator [Phycisphaerae bacterium]